MFAAAYAKNTYAEILFSFHTSSNLGSSLSLEAMVRRRCGDNKLELLPQPRDREQDEIFSSTLRCAFSLTRRGSIFESTYYN
jgi:hypothetical protein